MTTTERKQVQIEGELTFANVTPLCKNLNKFFSQPAAYEVSLAAVTKCDSASLVYLLCILEYSEQHNSTITFTQLPANMLTLIELYNLKKIIPIQA